MLMAVAVSPKTELVITWEVLDEAEGDMLGRAVGAVRRRDDDGVNRGLG